MVYPDDPYQDWEIEFIDEDDWFEEDEDYDYTYYSVEYAEDEDGEEVVVLSPWEDEGEDGWDDEDEDWIDDCADDECDPEGACPYCSIGEVMNNLPPGTRIVNIFL